MDVCMRGYRSVFWDIFVMEKCARGRGVGGLERCQEIIY